MRKIKQLENKIANLNNELERCHGEALSYAYNLMFLSKFNPDNLYSGKLKKELLNIVVYTDYSVLFRCTSDGLRQAYKTVKSVMESPESFDTHTVASTVKHIKDIIEKDNFVREKVNASETKTSSETE